MAQQRGNGQNEQHEELLLSPEEDAAADRVWQKVSQYVVGHKGATLDDALDALYGGKGPLADLL